MQYHISTYTRARARRFGVVVKNSTNAKKKIDIFRDGEKICSIGDPNYEDYTTYLKKYGKEIADERRRLYHIRHAKDIEKKGSPGWWASVLLW